MCSPPREQHEQESRKACEHLASEEDDRSLRPIAARRELKIHLQSARWRCAHAGRAVNRSCLIGPDGLGSRATTDSYVRHRSADGESYANPPLPPGETA